MKRLHYILMALIVAVGFLTACSPQRQMYRLLQRHPELRAPDNIRIYDIAIPTPGASSAVLLPKLENDPCNCDSLIKAALKDGISTTAGNAVASVIPTDSGLLLQAEQKPDTIHFHDTVQVPQYIIKAVPRDETDGELFLRHSGIVAWVIIGVAFVIWVVFLFFKR